MEGGGEVVFGFFDLGQLEGFGGWRGRLLLERRGSFGNCGVVSWGVSLAIFYVVT